MALQGAEQGFGLCLCFQQGRDGSMALKRWMLREFVNKNCRSGIPGRRRLPGIAIHMQRCPGASPELSWGFIPWSSIAQPCSLPAPVPGQHLSLTLGCDFWLYRPTPEAEPRRGRHSPSMTPAHRAAGSAEDV